MSARGGAVVAGVAGLAALALAAGGIATAQTADPAPGAAVYMKNCSVCHQAGGVGVAGVFPKLAGPTAKLAATPTGRKLLIATVLYGMAGKLPTEDGPVVGAMPALAKLSDDEIAAVLNHTSQLAGPAPKPFTAAEVAAQRAEPALTSAQVNALAKSP